VSAHPNPDSPARCHTCRSSFSLARVGPELVPVEVGGPGEIATALPGEGGWWLVAPAGFSVGGRALPGGVLRLAPGCHRLRYAGAALVLEVPQPRVILRPRTPGEAGLCPVHHGPLSHQVAECPCGCIWCATDVCLGRTCPKCGRSFDPNALEGDLDGPFPETKSD
jgi:hypothetical protein